MTPRPPVRDRLIYALFTLVFAAVASLGVWAALFGGSGCIPWRR